MNLVGRISMDYAASFHNTQLLDKQQAHLQPTSASRAERRPHPGRWRPLQVVAATVNLALPQKERPGPDVPLYSMNP